MPSARKILFLENGDILGGAELFSLDFFSSLRFCSDGDDDKPQYLVGIGNSHSVAWTAWEKESQKNQSFSLHSFFLPQLKPLSFSTIGKWFRSAYALRTFIRHENITHIHANTVRTFCIAGLAAVFLPRSLRFSFFAHDFTAPPFFLKLFSGRFFHIFACSQDVKEYLVSSGVKTEKVEVLPNGVDPEKFSHIPPLSAQSLASRPLNIGIIGRIDAWKGQHIFVQAAKIFLEIYPDAQFFIFGEPTAHNPQTIAFFEGLQQYVHDHHLEKNISFCGFIPPEKAFESLDILVHAATEKEPFGRVPIEGAMAGKGLILSRMGTPTHIFTDRENALFFEPKNAFDLAQKIKILWENRLHLEHIAKNAQVLAQENFLLSRVTQRLQDFFTATPESAD
ncbi:MAG: glycosyltransferase family 4 protein [Candidatus Peregrinibacteria bacterium]